VGTVRSRTFAVLEQLRDALGSEGALEPSPSAEVSCPQVHERFACAPAGPT
jgi:hypothetical protein